MLLLAAPRQKDRRLNIFYTLMIIILVIISLHQEEIKIGEMEEIRKQEREGSKEGRREEEERKKRRQVTITFLLYAF